MSDWTDEYLDVTPPCPWCGEELTDSPFDDCDCNAYRLIRCAVCDKPVMVSGRTETFFKARKEPFDAD